jgi:nifR3 family TIM-barrel protein
MSLSVSAANPGPRLGACQLAHPFVQAALSGYSDWPMRALARRHGASYTLAEVMIDRFVNEIRGTGKTSHYLHVAETDHPVGAQLMGSEPDTFEPAARRLVQAGFDVIDINFGCPVRTAMGGCRGGYHLGQPAAAIEIISRVRDVVPAELPVTLKMRRGIDETNESRDHFYQIFDAAWQRGINGITVHGRTVEQKYVGRSNWEFLRQVKEHAGSRTVLGSGDLFSAADCLKMIRYTGVDGVTIARGAIGNPWIFSQALALARGEPLPDPPSIHEQSRVLNEHRQLAESVYGRERWLRSLRKFGFKYARLHPDGIAVRAAFGGVKTISDWEDLLCRHYGEDGAGVHPRVDETTSEADENDEVQPASPEGR